MATSELKKTINELLQKKARRIVTGTVRAGRRTDILTVGKQGKYIRYRTPKTGDVSDIALLPTVKAAIMHSKGGKIQVKKRDYREKIRRRKISTLICLVLDTSSSMVMDAKMRGIKDALNELMLDAYQKRDRISLVISSGRSAEVVLPFTGSVERGMQFIERVQFGGTTPLAAGIRKGLENLKAKLRVEKDTNPLLVVVTDGSANTPLVPGEDILDEIRETCSVIEKSSIPTLIIDVGIEESETAKDIARLCGGRYYKVDHTDVLTTPVKIEDVMKFDHILELISLSLVDMNFKGMMFRARDKDIVSDVLRYLDSLSLEFRAVTGCQSGCDPSDSDSFCYHCRLKYLDLVKAPEIALGILSEISDMEQESEGDMENTEEEIEDAAKPSVKEGNIDNISTQDTDESILEIPTTLRTFPIVSLSSLGSKDELIGEIFVRFLATPSYMHKVNHGILFIENIDTMNSEITDILVETLKTRSYTLVKNGMSMTFPCKFSVIGSLSKEDAVIPTNLADQITIMIDSEPPDNLENKTKYIQYQKEYDADPANFQTKLERERRERIHEHIQARKILPDVSTTELLDKALEQMGSVLSDQECFPPKLKSLARICAAIKFKTEVTDTEAVEAIEIMRQQERLAPGKLKIEKHLLPFINIAESVAEAELIRDKLMSMLVAKGEIGGVMITGFNADSVRTSLRSLQDLSLNLLVPKGCKYLCDNDHPEEYCPECRLKFDYDKIEVEEQPMPVVFLPKDLTLKQLKGEVFVNYVLSPNLLTRANRGIVFIEDIDEMKPDIADAIAQVMSTGKNIVEKGNIIIEKPCKILVIATRSSPTVEIHPIIMDRMTAIIEATDVDRTLIKLKALQLLEEFGTHPEMFSAMILKEKEKSAEAVLEGQEIISEVEILDTQLDLIARMCNEFGVEGNNTEFNVEKVAKSLTAMRGDKRVDDGDIILAAKMVIPLAKLSTPEMQEYISRSLKDMVLQHA